MNLPADKYISKVYLTNNPTWDIEDSPWKADFVFKILNAHGIMPASICDLGCGAGEVLANLRRLYPDVSLYGYDIAPDAAAFWPKQEQLRINFTLGDFFELNKKAYDVILLLDVIEHIADPFRFLNALLPKTKYCIFHIPLDLSAFNVLREKPILEARKKVLHVNYFTKNLALSLLEECGFKVIEWKYSGVAFRGPRRAIKTKIANIPRKFLYAINKELGVRVLGGETLFVLAQGKL